MKNAQQKNAPDVQKHIRDLRRLFAIPTSRKYARDVVWEYAFDAQLLSLSPIYRQSRKMYLDLGGKFVPRACSTMRSLRSQDLFADSIDYSPLETELEWLKDNYEYVADASESLRGLTHLNEISIFHEQNHRILWRALPPAPSEQADFCRYLNFCESLVVTLDLCLGDQLGVELSQIFENLRVIYRPGENVQKLTRERSAYRQYLFAVMATTYFLLELRRPSDILKAVNYLLPGSPRLIKAAVKRGLELSPLFTINTNRQWQELKWKSARKSLAKLQVDSVEEPHYLPDDPLDLEEEFVIAAKIFDLFELAHLDGHS